MAVRKTVSHDAIEIINQKKKELTTFMVFTLVVLIVLIAFAIRPMVVKIVQINKEIERKQDVELKLQNKIDALNSLRGQYTLFKDDLEDLTLVLPNNWDFSLLVSNVEEIAIENDFELLSINIREFNYDEEDPKMQFEKIKPWMTNIRVRGNSSDLVSFFEDLENLPTYSTIDSLSYEVEIKDMTAEGDMEFNVGFRIYYIDDSTFYNIFEF